MTDNSTSPYAPPKSKLIDEDARDLFESEPKVYSFKGRIGRVKYAYFTLFKPIVALCIMIGLGNINELFILVSGLYYLVKLPLLFTFATTQRIHDIGKSGEWALLMLIPFAFLLICFIPGEKHRNQYGNIPPEASTSEVMKVGFSVLAAILVLWFVTSLMLEAGS